MTLVTVDLRRPDADGEYVAVRGAVEWAPTRRRATDGHVVLPQPFRHEASAPVTVDVAPTGPDWCWQVKELTNTGITRHVMVPDTPGPIAYTALVDVDPATLDPVAEPEAAWWAALTDYREETGTARDEAVAAAAGAAGSADAADLSASAAAASEGLAEGHASDASGSAGSAASSASAASGSAVAAAGSESAAAGHATDAQSALDLTVTARDLTLDYRDTAAGHATTATTQAGLATTARTGAEDALAATLAAVVITGMGRPDIPATLTPDVAALVAAASSGAEFRSLDGPQGAWVWRKKGATWVPVEGDTDWVDASSSLVNGWTGQLVISRQVDVITFRGNLDGSDATANVIAQLPAVWRPPARTPVWHPFSANDGNNIALPVEYQTALSGIRFSGTAFALPVVRFAGQVPMGGRPWPTTLTL